MAAAICGSPAQRGVQSSPKPTATGISIPALIRRAESLSTNFSPSERVMALYQCGGAEILYDRGRAETWLNQAFAMARSKLSPSHARSADEEGIVEAMAQVDLPRAVELFREQDTPSWGTPEQMHEDIRASAAVYLFPAILSSHGGKTVATIQSLSDWLGATGEYPYRAITSVITAIGAKHPNQARSLFAQAITYAGQDPGFLSTPPEFVQLLLKTQALVPSGLMGQGIDTALTLIQWFRKHDPLPSVVQAATPHGTAHLPSIADYLLYSLMPLVKEYDPERVEGLRQQNPYLAGLPVISPGIQLHPAGAILSRRNQSAAGLEFAREVQLGRLPSSARKRILALTHQMTTPYGRAYALAVAAAAQGGNAAQSESWLQQASKELDDLPANDFHRRLQLATRLTRAYLDLGKPQKAHPLAEAAFALGVKAYDRDLDNHPGKASYLVDGASGLRSLVVGVFQQAKDPQWMLNDIENLNQPELETSLLLGVVMGLQENARSHSAVK
ncbi:MAG: hypothetical protein ACRD0Y_06930 [Terriglobales bacterium]